MRSLSLLSVACLSVAMACAANTSACYPLSTDQIMGRDLAVAVPQLAFLPPDLKLGYSPAAGAQRLFRASQLEQLGERYGIKTKITAPVCFAWALKPLSSQLIADVMKKSLAAQGFSDGDVDLEVTDQYHSPVPDGEVSFPLQGLSAASDKPAIWSGFVTYAGARKFTTWAQVRITVHQRQIVATRAISAGEMIGASDLMELDYRGPLKRLAILEHEADVLGKCARWSIPAGTVFTGNILQAVRDVAKDELVTVHIDSGAAHIETQGIADDGGYKGNVIRVRNTKTGRVFRARIDDRGVVTVVPGGMVGLVVEDKKS